MAKKTEKPIEKIEFPSQYTVLSADLSLRQPGFCLLHIKKNINGLAVITEVKLMSVRNKTKQNKTHGELLDDIISAFIEFCPDVPNLYFVRETEVLHMKVPSERNVSKVVGMMDWAAWCMEKEWYSVYPVTVKKLVTGSGKAEKSEVAAALEKYIGKQEYRCDDESDAAAVAIAWLIQQGQIKE